MLTIAMAASGMLIQKMASHPNAVISRPPRTGPTAAELVSMTWMRPIIFGALRPEVAAIERSMAAALGKAAAVPTASSTRAAVTQSSVGAKGPAAPATAMMTMPIVNTRRGP